jgi:hypothetical protein
MFNQSVPGVSTKFDGSLDIEVTGLEDLGITHIIEVGVTALVLGTDPATIQVAVQPAKKTTAAVSSIKAQVAGDKRQARHLASNWYVQDLTFSHFSRDSRFARKVAVYSATAARCLEPTKTESGWAVKVGGQIKRPANHNELLLAKVYA